MPSVLSKAVRDGEESDRQYEQGGSPQKLAAVLMRMHTSSSSIGCFILDFHDALLPELAGGRASSTASKLGSEGGGNYYVRKRLLSSKVLYMRSLGLSEPFKTLARS
jgi:hypothetical protein